MSPVVPVSNGVVSHLIGLINRDVAVLDMTPNLGAPGRRTRHELEAVAHRLTELLRHGQSMAILVHMSEDGVGNLHLADATVVAATSVATLRRRIGEGWWFSRQMVGNKLVVSARDLLRWVEAGKPNGRRPT